MGYYERLVGVNRCCTNYVQSNMDISDTLYINKWSYTFKKKVMYKGTAL